VTKPLAVLPYYGGKQQTAAWIVQLLPPVAAHQVYVEPFAGMLTVLLNRPPAPYEIANDLNGHIVAWWRAVRDHPNTLARMLRRTPNARAEWERARDVLTAAESRRPVDPAEHGWAAAVGIAQSYRRTASVSGNWQRGGHNGLTSDYATAVAAAGRRLRRVRLDSAPAEDIIEHHAPGRRTVMYCDPPYATGGDEYGQPMNADRVLAALTRARAAVAISGYPNCPWAELERHGWARHEHHRTVPMTAGRPDGKTSATEVVWTNYPPAGQQRLPVE